MSHALHTVLRRSALLTLLLLVAVSFIGCSDDEGISEDNRPVSAASTLAVSMQELPINYVTSGTVTSDHRVSISSRISGYIREMTVREGDSVKEGEVLVRIDPVDAKQALIQAKADLADAETDLKRYKELLKVGAVTNQQAEKVQLRYKVAKSQVEQARNQLSYAEVSSPVAGVVVEKRLSQGDLAAPGTAILTLEDPASLLVETYVSEQFVSKIHEGDEVDIKIASQDRLYQGVVRQVVQAADSLSHQFLVKTALSASPDIHPGMYAQTGFHTGSRQAILIPREAVISRSGLHAVYLVSAQSVAQYRLIRLGETRGDQVEVLAGLNDGDVVAWSGVPTLKSGIRVKAVSTGQ